MINFLKKYLNKYKALKKFPKFIITTVFSCLLVSSLIFGWAMIEVIRNPEEYTTTKLSETVIESHEYLYEALSDEQSTVTDTQIDVGNSLDITSSTSADIPSTSYTNEALNVTGKIVLSDIPPFSDKPYVVLNNNQPYFNSSDYTTDSFEYYSSLDNQGRCGIVYACIGKDIMPTGERGETGQIKPTGWHTVKYDIVDGKFLYNRCHLIGWQLTGETSNKRNLITGTRYLNIQGMLPFENMVADYIKETENHVLYRVTPCFEKNNLLAHGVQIEAYSVEDGGAGICFNVFCYNAQPGVTIDYSSGNSKLTNDTYENTTLKTTEKASKPTTQRPTSNSSVEKANYVANTNTGKFHYPSCSSVDDMKEENKMLYNGTRDELISDGYVPCKRCDP